jgi:hypothetical protein
LNFGVTRQGWFLETRIEDDAKVEV